MNQVVAMRPSEAFSPEAEQHILGHLLLLNAEGIQHVIMAGGADLFGDPFHADLFRVIDGKAKAGALVSVVTVSDATRTWQDISGMPNLPEYLARMAATCPGPSQFKPTIEYMAELRQRRGLIDAVTEAQASLARGDEHTSQIAGRLEAALIGKDAQAGGGPVPMARAVMVAMEETLAAYQGEVLPCVSTGIVALDRMVTGFFPGEFILLGGRPSMGKTGVALSIALNAARAGNGVCIASLEMNPEAMALRALSEATAHAKTAVSYKSLRRGDMTEAQAKTLRGVAKGVAELPVTFLPRRYADVGALYAGARQADKTLPGGLKLLVVDYLQLMEAEGKNRTEEIGGISRALKLLAGRLNVPVLALSQLSRALESRDDKRPQMSDLRESGQLEQDADVILFCYRGEYYLERLRPNEQDSADDHAEWQACMDKARNRLEIIVAKQRNGDIGTAHVRFNPAINMVWEGQ